GEISMRHVKAFVMAVSASALIAACDQQTPSTPAADPAAAAAEREAAVAQALEARLAEATKVHESSGPLVYFANLKDGDAVASPFRVVFGLHGMGIAPALVEKENTGHLHLLIDTELSE